MSGLTDVSTALVGTGFAYRKPKRAWQGRFIASLLPQIRDIRRMGAASVDLCSVASGRLDAYVEEGLGPWDLAAGAIIATEAGAVISDWSDGPVRPGQVFVSTPGIATNLRKAIAIAVAEAGNRPD